jgi:hypothetical protein
MDWYCALTGHLLREDNIINTDKPLGSILKHLEELIVTLYEAILLYQMKSVCSYYRHQGFNFLLQLRKWDDWDGVLKSVIDAETMLRNGLNDFIKAHAKSSMETLDKRAENMETLLGDIRQNLRAFTDQQQKIQMDNENKECFRDLRVVNPQDDMDTIEKGKEALSDDAYNWILEDEKYEAFTNWDETTLSSRRLLWLKGDAGTGKTMLLIGIIRELSRQSAVLTPSLSYCFCQSQGKTDLPLNSATATMRSLIWMLLIQQPHLNLAFTNGLQTLWKGSFYRQECTSCCISRFQEYAGRYWTGVLHSGCPR